MRSKAEKLLARSLRAALADIPVGGSIQDSERMPDIRLSLEFWVPQVLGWDEESLDGFKFSLARKTADSEAELLGLGLLISDQQWTPLRVVVRVSQSADAVTAFECGLGEPGEGANGMLRLPYKSPEAQRLLERPPEVVRTTRWAFTAHSGRVTSKLV